MRVPIYVLEELDINDIDLLIERGVVFDVTNKASLLPENERNAEADDYWGIGDRHT